MTIEKTIKVTKFPLKLDLQHFAEGDPDPNPNDDDKTPNPNGGETKTEPKTFTQEDLDKIVAERVAREKKKLDKYADYDDLKKQIEEFNKQKEEKEFADLGDKEKAEKLAEAEKKRAEKLEAQLNSTLEKVKTQAVKNTFRELAAKHNIEYVDDAFRLADLTDIEVSDEFEVKGMEDIIKKMVEEKPYLVKKVEQEDKEIGNPSNPSKPKSDKTNEELLQEARNKAEKSGRVEDMVAYSQLKRKLGL